ncbi:uncharacterized protein LOC107042454 [Diachasma alloeum]|uniref:uncharacterized protein LOC107042454 n=1 Tax=Diachasma alloeum TaxID=454923 RepID=UPI0007384F7F|nr:uncharacterized protein LOC107042454 [Diachasma alloeum]
MSLPRTPANTNRTMLVLSPQPDNSRQQFNLSLIELEDFTTSLISNDNTRTQTNANPQVLAHDNINNNIQPLPALINEISDILLDPLVENQYGYFKEEIRKRFTDSADKQLEKALSQLTLGNQKPSQLLRKMRALVAGRASEDILRVRWLSLLPLDVQRILKATRFTTLSDFTPVADELMEVSSTASVMAASSHARFAVQKSSDPVTTELAELRQAMTQLINLNRTMAESLERLHISSRSKSRSRAPSISRSSSPAPQVLAVGDSAFNNNDHDIREHHLFFFDPLTKTQFLVNTGSVISIIPRAATQPQERPAELKLYAANDVQTAIIGADFLVHFGLLVDLQDRSLFDKTTNLQAPGQLSSFHKYIDVTKPAAIPSISTSSRTAHHIPTTGPPVAERPRRLAGEKLQAAKDNFDLLLQYGVIRPSSSSWASPVHMVPKKNGGWRATGDYRQLNRQTLPDRYPIPHIEDVIQSCHGSSIFTTLDLVRAYNQIPVATDDIAKNAVTTPFGLFEFVGMPPGLCNAAQTFQRHMDGLRDIDFAAYYIDDIIIFSKDPEEHQGHVETILKLLLDNHLSINPSKCQFGQEESPPPAKVETILQFPKPETIEDLRRFLGMVNYYRRCIPQAAAIQAPLNDHLKNAKKKDKREVPWTPESEAALELCKQRVASAVRASFLFHAAPLALSTDASDSVIGAALEQFVNDNWQPLGFFSRKLSPTETRYSTYDRELLPIFSGIKYFNHIVEGREFVVKTNHKPPSTLFINVQRKHHRDR